MSGRGALPMAGGRALCSRRSCVRVRVCSRVVSACVGCVCGCVRVCGRGGGGGGCGGGGERAGLGPRLGLEGVHSAAEGGGEQAEPAHVGPHVQHLPPRHPATVSHLSALSLSLSLSLPLSLFLSLSLSFSLSLAGCLLGSEPPFESFGPSRLRTETGPERRSGATRTGARRLGLDQNDSD